MKIKYTFWTGGFDSTFRILQLSRENVTVQPIYIVDPGRISSDKEIAAINKLPRCSGAIGRYLQKFSH